VFIVLGKSRVPIAVPFYMWLGIVSLLGIAQFWSLAADLHSREAGERLFGVIAIGGSAGAIVGAPGWRTVDRPLGIYGLMSTAAALYVIALVVVGSIERTSPGPAAARAACAAAPTTTDGVALVVPQPLLCCHRRAGDRREPGQHAGEFILAEASSGTRSCFPRANAPRSSDDSTARSTAW
jgi:hypothetical protein